MRINIHAGHNPDGKVACGASGLLKESTEARKVKDKLIELLLNDGHTVYDCTVNDGSSQSDVLAKIVQKCNSHAVDIDISIHLNSGRNDYKGDGATGGTEVLVYSNTGIISSYANNVCKAISALGFNNRGVKVNTGLYVLKNTKAPAMLIECCFVDDKDDADKWNADKCAGAIFKGITGKETSNSVNLKYTIAGTSSKMFAFKIRSNAAVRLEPLSNANKVASVSKGSKQGINKISAGGFGFIANGAGWVDLKKKAEPVQTTLYEVNKSSIIVRECAESSSNAVATLKRGSLQPVCFVTDDGWGLIANFAGWIKLSDCIKR